MRVSHGAMTTVPGTISSEGTHEKHVSHYKAFRRRRAGVLASPRTRPTSPARAQRFRYPIYAKWAEAYKQKTGVGHELPVDRFRRGGIKQIQAKTVDFGASDAPLKPEELQKSGLMQFPAIIGGVVPDREPRRHGAGRDEAEPVRCLATSIWASSRSGTTSRSPTSIPALKLPDENITVVRRSDGSGTSFLWTDLPVAGQSGVEGKGRRQHGGGVAGRRGRQGQRRRVPPTCSGSRVPSATLNTRTRRRTR